MKRLVAFSFLLLASINFLQAREPYAAKKDIYEIRVYHFANKDQENIIDNFLKDAFIPALHRNNVKSVGVFKAVANDTATDKRVYVFIPYKSMEEFLKLPAKLDKDKAFQESGSAYINAPYQTPPYTRMEKILLEAFDGMISFSKPNLDNSKEDNIYELRSYEGHTEKIHQNKVDMFNKGDEVSLFKRLNFNAVFYAEVLAGSRMPNLMYMTSFNNMQDRDEHWKTFSADAVWKKLSSDPNYQHNVSRNEIVFLHPASYSEL